MTLHVYQKNNNDCMLACVAMAAGRPYDELWTAADIEDVIERQGADNKFTSDLLERAGFHPYVNGDRGKIVWKVNVGDHQSRGHFLTGLLRGRRAILSVPSLNHFAGWHAVYWDGHELFDPNNPANGKQIYRWIEQLAPREVWVFDETPALAPAEPAPA